VSYIWHEQEEVHKEWVIVLPRHDLDSVVTLNGQSWQVVDRVHNIYFRELVYYVEPYENDEL
jgi:hypothetical protein